MDPERDWHCQCFANDFSALDKQPIADRQHHRFIVAVDVAGALGLKDIVKEPVRNSLAGWNLDVYAVDDALIKSYSDAVALA